MVQLLYSELNPFFARHNSKSLSFILFYFFVNKIVFIIFFKEMLVRIFFSSDFLLDQIGNFLTIKFIYYINNKRFTIKILNHMIVNTKRQSLNSKIYLYR